MSETGEEIEAAFAAVDRALEALQPRAGAASAAVERWRAQAAAVRAHLGPGHGRRPMVVVLGGTGTGKSTLVNRLLGGAVTAASFRRTFTAGCVAVAADAAAVPPGWLGRPHAVAAQRDLPARGKPDSLLIVPAPPALPHRGLLDALTLIDAPDLDGDQPANHAQADRAFHWADAVVFLATPEKWRLPELLPYYDLARRYGVTSLFVMNKCRTADDARGYQSLIGAEPTVPEPDAAAEPGEDASWANATWANATDTGIAAATGSAPLYMIPRDGSGFVPSPGADLDALRETLGSLTPSSCEHAPTRARDLLHRLDADILGPLRQARQTADRAVASVRALASTGGATALAHRLDWRLRQRSIAFLLSAQVGSASRGRAPARGNIVAQRDSRSPGRLSAQGRSTVAGDSAGANSVSPPDVRTEWLAELRLVEDRIADALQDAGLPRAPSDPAATPGNPALSPSNSGAASGNPGAASGNPGAASGRPGAASGRPGVASGKPFVAPGKPAPGATGRALGEPARASGEFAGDPAAGVVDELTAAAAWLVRRAAIDPGEASAAARLSAALAGSGHADAADALPYLLAVAAAVHPTTPGPADIVPVDGSSLIAWVMERLGPDTVARLRQSLQTIAGRFADAVQTRIARAVEKIEERAPSAEEILRVEAAVQGR